MYCYPIQIRKLLKIPFSIYCRNKEKGQELIDKFSGLDIVDKEFNKDYMNLRIKYFGKLEKMIIQLKKENIDLQMTNDEWTIKAL